MESYSLYDIYQSLEEADVGSSTPPDYCPPNIQWTSPSGLYIPAGRYYHLGPRINQQYVDFDNGADYWTVASGFTVATNECYLNNSKVVSSWYSVYMVGENSVLLLPHLRVHSFDHTSSSGNTTVRIALHDDSNTTENGYCTVSGMYSGYRAVYHSNFLWEANNGYVCNVLDSYTNDRFVLEGLCGSPVPVYASAATVHSGTGVLYMLEGDTNDYGALNGFWKFNFVAQRWQKLSNTSAPTTGMYAGIAVDTTNNAIYTFGGYDGNSNNEFYKYDIATDTWSQPSVGTKPNTRHGLAMIYDDVTHALWVYGGRESSTWNDFQDVWKYDIATTTWTQVRSTSSPGTRSYMGWFKYGRYLYVYGGYNDPSDQNYDDMWRYHLDTDTWSQVSNPATRPTPVRLNPMCIDEENGFAYLIGGQNTSLVSINQFWKYNITNNTWEDLGGWPVKTRGTTIGYYNGLVFCCGGYDDERKCQLSEQYLYDTVSSGIERLYNAEIYGEGDSYWGSVLTLAPPAGIPSLYLGSIKLDDSGDIQEFNKFGWNYTWTEVRGIDGYRGAAFGNSFLGRCVPVTAYEVKASVTIGSEGSPDVSLHRALFASGEGGGYVDVGYHMPSSNNRETINMAMSWYLEESNAYRRDGQPCDYRLTRIQLIRNRFHASRYGSQRTPDYGSFDVVGFTE